MQGANVQVVTFKPFLVGYLNNNFLPRRFRICLYHGKVKTFQFCELNFPVPINRSFNLRKTKMLEFFKLKIGKSTMGTILQVIGCLVEVKKTTVFIKYVISTIT